MNPLDDIPEDASTDFILGRISGQLRELIHQNTNILQGQTAMGLRIAALEAAEQQRIGERGVITAILKSPFIAWIISVAALAWAFLTGKVHV